MRPIFLFLLYPILVYSCQSKQAVIGKESRQTDQLTELDGRWTLFSVKGQNVSSLSYMVNPTLEVNSAEKRIGGSDGCNNFFGQLEKLDDKSLIIGLMGSTKAICPEMKDTDMLGQYLTVVRTYKIAGKKLYLYSDTGIEVLVYTKTNE